MEDVQFFQCMYKFEKKKKGGSQRWAEFEVVFGVGSGMRLYSILIQRVCDDISIVDCSLICFKRFYMLIKAILQNHFLS